MKKTFSMALTTLALGAFMFAGCKKDINSSNQKVNELLSGTESEECVFNFSDDELQNIGSEHNRMVQEVFTYYLPYGSIDLRDAINKASEENQYEPITQDEFEKLQAEYSADEVQNTLGALIDEMDNASQKEIFYEMISAVTENTDSYEKIEYEINALKERARSELTCYELTGTLVALEVCKNSAKLWLPEQAGGEGYFDYIDAEISGKSAKIAQARGFWSSLAKIVIGDATGAFSGFVTGAMPYIMTGGAANPISNAVLAGHTINGAVRGSVMAGVGAAIH